MRKRYWKLLKGTEKATESYEKGTENVLYGKGTEKVGERKVTDRYGRVAIGKVLKISNGYKEGTECYGKGTKGTEMHKKSYW